jgi:hypothetical protein
VGVSLGARGAVDAYEDASAWTAGAHSCCTLAAIAHANGMTTPGKTIEIIDERPQYVPTDPLHTWPED